MTYLWLTPLALLLGCFLGFWMARRRYFGAFKTIKADKTAKILSAGELSQAKKDGEALVKLDFATLIKMMELKEKLWMGHKHSKDVGVWINFLKTLLNKEANTIKK